MNIEAQRSAHLDASCVEEEMVSTLFALPFSRLCGDVR